MHVADAWQMGSHALSTCDSRMEFHCQTESFDILQESRVEVVFSLGIPLGSEIVHVRWQNTAP